MAPWRLGIRAAAGSLACQVACHIAQGSGKLAGGVWLGAADLSCCASALLAPQVHTLIGAGAAEGAIDAANILKPALARGELQCIGATTLDEYRKHIEKDPALER